MKKLGLVLMCMLLATTLFAVDVTIGGAIGPNTSFMSGSDWDDMIEAYDGSNEFRIGFEIGAFFDIAINEFFSIQPEINFLLLRAGAGNSDYDVEATATIYVLEIPVLAKFNLEAGNGIFSFFFGPSFQILLGDPNITAEVGGTEVMNEDMSVDNSVLFAGVVGIGYAFPVGNGNLYFDLRYRRQFTTFDDDFNGKVNNIGLRIGYGITVR